MTSQLQQFIDILAASSELNRITVECDPVLEIAAITDRVCKEPKGGRALLFEHPAGSKFPVATNLFGSIRRIELALGVDSLEQLGGRLAELLRRIPSPDLAVLDRQIAALPEFSRFTSIRLNEPDHGLVSMEPPDLTRFPFLQSWPEDGSSSGHSRYITLPLVFTASPDGGSPNCGMYRAQVRSSGELAIQWKEGSGAARHLAAYRRLGQPMPVVIALGGPPAATFSAFCPLPGDLDEMVFAGFLQNAPLQMVPCRSVPLRVPAGCEVVVEGYVAPGETVMEGPFGNHTGCYSPAAPAALLRVTGISHRPAPVIPATVVGPPPMEDCWMAKMWEKILLAFLQRLLPEIRGMTFPLEWVFHQSAIISLEKPRPGMVSETAARLWDTPWFAAARLLVFVDAGNCDCEPAAVAWRCINLVGFDHDIIRDRTGKRMAIDATGCRGEKQPVVPLREVVKLVERRWQEYGLG